MVPSRQYGVLQDVELESPTSKLNNHQSLAPVPITLKQKLYVLGMQGVGAGVLNGLINGVLAYVMYRHSPLNTIAFSGTLTCVVSDVIITAFLIPCLTGIIGTALVHNDLRLGKLITPIDHHHLAHPMFKHVPTGQSWMDIVKRSILFGFLGVLVFAPVTLLIIYMCTGTRGMQAVWGYVAFKGYWGGLEAMILSPMLAFIAIAQEPSNSNNSDNSNSSSSNLGEVEYTVASLDASEADIEEQLNKGALPGPDSSHQPSYIVT